MVAKTNADGLAILHGVGTGAVDLFATSSAPLGEQRRQPLGVIPAGVEDANREICFEGHRDVVVTFSIGGDRRLPARVEFSTNGGFLGPVELDPERARARFRVWTDRGRSRVSILVQSAGRRNEQLGVGFEGDARTVFHELRLRPLARVGVAVTPPVDEDYTLVLQVAGTFGSWVTVRGAWFDGHGDHRYVLEGLHPGRYRVVDAVSGRCSDSFLLRDGEVESAVSLDLIEARWIGARLALPAGVDPSATRLTVSRPRAHLRPAVRRVDGRYQVRWPAECELTVLAWHPNCGGEQAAARAELRSGLAPPDLVLERRVRVAFALAVDAATASVRLFDGAAHELVAAYELRRAANDEPFTFDVLAGRYDLRVDVAERAPLWLAGVELVSSTDLGALDPPLGEAVTVALRMAVPAMPPAYEVTAVGLDGVLLRRASSDQHARATLRGLLPGRYRLEVRSVPSALVELRLDREIAVRRGHDEVVTMEVGRATPRKNHKQLDGGR